ncbi:unnamed protein product [Rhodiola kirilowii]
MESDPRESLWSEGSRNWLELPPEVTATILQKVGVVDILNNAQRVCTSWRSICRDPSMWRSIDLQLDLGFDSEFDVEEMAMHAVDRSCGQLVNLSIAYFATDRFIHHLAQSSTQLRRLQIIYCYDLSEDVLKETASKFTMLEELKVQSTPFSVAAVEAIGRCCLQLKTFKCNVFGFSPMQAQHDDLANFIAKAMPHICNLQLLGTKITNTGLKAILDGCVCLETLDIRDCYLVDPKVENVGEFCTARYKKVRFPGERIEPGEIGGSEPDFNSDDSFDDHSIDFSGHFDEPSDFYDLFSDGVDYDDIFYDEDGIDYGDMFGVDYDDIFYDEDGIDYGVMFHNEEEEDLELELEEEEEGEVEEEDLELEDEDEDE